MGQSSLRLSRLSTRYLDGIERALCRTLGETMRERESENEVSFGGEEQREEKRERTVSWLHHSHSHSPSFWLRRRRVRQCAACEAQWKSTCDHSDPLLSLSLWPHKVGASKWESWTRNPEKCQRCGRRKQLSAEECRGVYKEREK